jgi:tRNA nucleotidyltransferase (CCA-adding enzyme)
MDQIFQTIHDEGGKPYFVGGAVRDKLMGIVPKDFDIEVFGLSPDRLKTVLSQFGRVDSVGVSFGVLKLYMENGVADFTLPRRENKQGKGYKGFVVEPDPFMTLREASARRDFTINSIMQDALTCEIIDNHGGIQDLKDRILRATDTNHFGEDPLRVLRGFQLSSRFDLTIDDETAEMCKSLITEYNELSPDRIWIEWHKWAVKSVKPSAGLKFLEKTGWDKIYPEISNMKGVRQNPVWHPEIFVDVHVQHVCDEATHLSDRDQLSEDDRLMLLFSCLCHDFAKPICSRGEYPNIVSPQHDQKGVAFAENFLYRINAPQWLINHVKPLVSEHMAYINCGTEKAVRKLAIRLEPSNIEMLLRLIECDASGRPPKAKGLPEKAKEMWRLANTEQVVQFKPKRILYGKHLQGLNFVPGPIFGEIIARCYEMQVNGLIKNLDEAREWGGIKLCKKMI